MTYKLPPLPYPSDALQPHISQETVEVHYHKHHQGYLNELLALREDVETEKDLERIIKKTFIKEPHIFQMAAQVYNHNLYWQSLIPNGCAPPKEAAQLLREHFGGVDEFKREFTAAATGRFGSGWIWLTMTRNNKLWIESTQNADTPLADGRQPILVFDVWEHAYYLDRKSDRGQYIDAFWNLINWNLLVPFAALRRTKPDETIAVHDEMGVSS